MFSLIKWSLVIYAKWFSLICGRSTKQFHYLAELVPLALIILVTLRNVAFIRSCTTTFDTEHPRRRYLSIVGSSYHKLPGNAPCHALARSLKTLASSATRISCIGKCQCDAYLDGSCDIPRSSYGCYVFCWV